MSKNDESECYLCNFFDDGKLRVMRTYGTVQSIAVQDSGVSNQVLRANHKFNKLKVN